MQLILSRECPCFSIINTATLSFDYLLAVYYAILHLIPAPGECVAVKHARRTALQLCSLVRVDEISATCYTLLVAGLLSAFWKMQIREVSSVKSQPPPPHYRSN